MLARITYGLVVAALVTLIAGFFQKSSNALLYVSIALSVVAIVLVIVGAARRAREAPGEESDYEPAFETGLATLDEEIPPDLISPFEDDEEEEEEVELALDLGDDEDEEDIELVPTRRSTSTRAAVKPATKPAATRARPAAKTGAATATRAAAAPKKAAAAAKAPAGKVIVVAGRDRYHAPTCRFIQGKDGTEEVTLATAKRRGYQPCSACKPGA